MSSTIIVGWLHNRPNHSSPLTSTTTTSRFVRHRHRRRAARQRRKTGTQVLGEHRHATTSVDQLHITSRIGSSTAILCSVSGGGKLLKTRLVEAAVVGLPQLPVVVVSSVLVKVDQHRGGASTPRIPHRRLFKFPSIIPLALPTPLGRITPHTRGQQHKYLLAPVPCLEPPSRTP